MYSSIVLFKDHMRLVLVLFMFKKIGKEHVELSE